MTRRDRFAGMWACVCGMSLLAARMDADEASPPVPTPTVSSAAADVPVPEEDGASSPTIALQYRFLPGQALHYVTSDVSIVDVEQGGEATTVKYSTQTWKHYQIRSVDADGTAVLEIVIDRVLMRAEGDGKVIEFDSRQPGPAPAEFSHLLDAIGRAAVAMTVTPSGRMESAELRLGAATRPLPLQDRDSQLLAALPAEPVAVGAVWKERFDVPVKVEGKLSRNIRLQRNYKLTALDGNRATIDLETVILTPVNDPELESQLIQRTPSGVLILDLEQGVLTSKRTTLHNQVVGFSGDGSKLKVFRTYEERLNTDAALTARLPSPAATAE